MNHLRSTILAFALIGLATLNASAGLTAVVTPGYQFPLDGSVAPTFTLLNYLATPTIQIVGSIGGSNTLSAGSVTGTSMSDTFPDGITLDYNSSSPRQIEIKRQGVSTNELNTNDWYWPLVQGNVAQFVQLKFDPIEFRTNASGLALILDNSMGTNANGVAVRADPIQFLTNNNGLVVNYDAGFFTTNGSGITLTNFVSAQFTMAVLATNGACLTLTHGLSRLPAFVKFVLVCAADDSGYTAGDEIDVNSVRNSGTGGQSFNVVASATKVFLIQVNGSNNPQIFNKTTGAVVNITTASSNWRFKCYARP